MNCSGPVTEKAKVVCLTSDLVKPSPQVGRVAARELLRTVLLDIEVQRKLQRMRTHTQGSEFFVTFVGNTTINQLLTEDIALEQEVMICLERFQRLVK